MDSKGKTCGISRPLERSTKQAGRLRRSYPSPTKEISIVPYTVYWLFFFLSSEQSANHGSFPQWRHFCKSRKNGIPAVPARRPVSSPCSKWLLLVVFRRPFFVLFSYRKPRTTEMIVRPKVMDVTVKCPSCSQWNEVSRAMSMWSLDRFYNSYPFIKYIPAFPFWNRCRGTRWVGNPDMPRR